LLDTDDIIDQIMTYQTWQEYETQPIFQSELKGDFLNFQKTNGSFDNSIKTTYYALDSLGQPDLEITNITSTSSLINKETAIFEIGIDNNGYAGADDAVIHLFIDNFNPQWEIDLSASSVVIEPGHSVNISVSLPTTVSLMGDTDIKVYVENSDDIDYEDNWLNESFNFAAALDSSPALPVYYIAQDYNDAGQAGLNVRWPVKEDPSRSWYVILYKESGTSTWNQAWVDNTLNGIFWTNPYFVEGTVYDVTVGSIDLSETTVTYFGNDITQVQVSASDDVYTSSATGTVTENINPAAYINTFCLWYVR